jgi:hypothetical protein
MALSAILTEGIKYVPALVQAFTSNRKTSGERRQQELLNQQLDLQRQAFDPNSQLYKQQLAIENANSSRNIASMVQAVTQNQRRNLAMGRNPLFDNERADEVLSRFQNSEVANAAAEAPSRARQNILDMASGVGTSANAMGSMAQRQADRMGGRSAQLTRVAEELFNPASGRSIIDVISGRGGQPQQTIQQAAPTPKNTVGNTMMEDEAQRRMGGMNMANLPIMQGLQRGSTRQFQGGRR